MIKKYLILVAFISLTNCNTVTGSIEGTALGVKKMLKLPIIIQLASSQKYNVVI